MGIKSTHTISKEVAQQILLAKIITLDNETLSRWLGDLPESHFMNYTVVSSDEGVVECEPNEHRRIRTLKRWDELKYEERG